MDKCAKCGGDQFVGRFGFFDESGRESFPVCDWCIADTEGFKQWLAIEAEKVWMEAQATA